MTNFTRLTAISILNISFEGFGGVMARSGFLLADKSATILFKLEEKTIFSFFIYYTDGVWSPGVVIHSDDHCPMCQMDFSSYSFSKCHNFNTDENIEILFELVLNHPKFRLKKLFL